jgi:hypothetical protein
MKEYLFLFRGGEAHHNGSLSAQEEQAHMERWMQWMSGLAEQGIFGGAQPLQRTGMQITGSKKVVTDGPFIEGKEMVGGYLICKANTYEEAMVHAKNCPLLEFEDSIVEVREIKEMKS